MNKIKRIFFPPKKELPLYETLGSEQGIKELVSNFYEKMETDPRVRECLETHQVIDGKVPEPIKEKLFWFLSGWLGGPNLFMEKVGAPRMRARHGHIKISERERDQWLYCMETALSKHSIRLNDHDYSRLMQSFMALAHRIQNLGDHQN